MASSAKKADLKKASPRNSDSGDINNRLEGFLLRHRRIVLGIGAVIIAGGVIFAAAAAIRNRFLEKNTLAVEELQNRFVVLRIDINEPEKAEAVEALVGDLRALGAKSAYAGARAWGLLGDLEAERDNWAEAEAAWKEAARKAPRLSYMVPLFNYQAAVAAEEQEEYLRAIDFYKECLVHGAAFPAAVRAQFALGRLYETLNNQEEALGAYWALLNQWQDEAEWVKLAQDRIISLSYSADERIGP
jgi:tetratricopeptide (TPR) repeat protein